jgi:MFS family permease
MQEALMQGGARSEWRRGWHLVGLTALGLTVTPTTLPVYTIGVFVPQFEASFGWSRGAIQTAILFSTGLAVICAPLAGWMIRRWGIRNTILPGVVGMALACLLGAGIDGSLWQLYGVYALMSLLGAGAGAVGWTTLVAGNFDKARGLALGIGLSGTGLCSILMPMIAAASLAQWGWRGAYVALAAFCLLVVLTVCWLLLPRDAPSGAAATGRIAGLSGMEVGEAVRTRRFWQLGLSTFAIYAVIGGTIPNLVPAFTDAGLSMAQAASIMGIFGMTVIGGRIAVGALVDRFWAPAVAALVMVPAAIACLIIGGGGSYLSFAVAAAMLGIATGTELDVLGYLVARYFGVADYARIYGCAYMFVAASAGIAPPLIGFVYDITGNYGLPMQISAGLLLFGAIGLLLLGKYPEWDRVPITAAA